MPLETDPITTELISVWLLPDAASAGRFQPVIDELARRHGAPSFEPHVTLWLGRGPIGRAEDLLRPILAGFPPFAVDAGPTGHTDHRFKTLFVTFPAAPFAELQRAVAARFRPDDHRFAPHLSLLYHRLGSARRAELVEEQDHRGLDVRFDATVVVRPRPGHGDFDDVAAWRASARLPLGATPGRR